MMYYSRLRVTKLVLGESRRSPRQLSRFVSQSPNFTPKELSISVPWGHIAGLHWNETTSALPILCLHGWKDNASSFSRLIPAILSETSKYQFICIDLPGHGFSSHYPPGMMYQATDTMIAVRRVIRHFGWSEVKGIHLMGHSLGAILGFFFAATHSEIIDCLIAIDALVPVTLGNTDLAGIMGNVTRGVLELEDKFRDKPPKSRTKNELFERMLNSHMFGLTKDACEVLMTRAVMESPSGSGKYKWAHDPKVQFLPLMEFGMDYIQHLAESFDSNLLHIKAENGVSYLSEKSEESVQKWIEKGNKKLIRYTVAKKGLHHVHLMEPEKIAPMILQFLSETHK